MKNLPENHAFIHELLHNQTDIANFFVSGQNPTNLCWEPWLTPFSLIFCGKIYITSGPITSWQIDGETMETARDFIFLGSKITANDDCSHEMKRCLFLRRKSMTNLHSALKSRDMTLLKKGLSSQGYGFSSSHVWMWELGHKESWAPKNWCF